MNINGLVFTLLLSALVLAAIAVIIDRLNFPQRPFRPKRLQAGHHGPDRDRTGAHIRDVYIDERRSGPDQPL